MTEELLGGAELVQRVVEKEIGRDALDKVFWIPHNRFPNDPEKQGLLIQEMKADPRPKILFKHGNPFEDPKNLGSKEWQDLFDVVVFVSNWQLEQFQIYHQFPDQKAIVIPNGFYPIDWQKNKKTDKIKLIYISTPFRGLDVLLLALSGLEKRKDWELDVYSSVKLYGWSDEQDKPFQPLYDYCKQHPQINYHSSVPNSEIRTALSQAHILAYPCTFQETFCISVVEAMSAGCQVLCSNRGVLPETCGQFATMYPYLNNREQHALRFVAILNSVLDQFWQPEIQNHLQLQKQYVDDVFGWEKVIPIWKELFISIENTLGATKDENTGTV